MISKKSNIVSSTKKYYFIFNEGSKINQILCAILINIPAFVYGASIGWMSPMTLLLQSDKSPRAEPLTDVEVSWMGAVAYLICIPSDFIMAWMSDKFGRKATLIIISATSACCWIIKLSSFETWALILARAFVALPMAGCYVTGPLYSKEISEDSIRGALGALLHWARVVDYGPYSLYFERRPEYQQWECSGVMIMIKDKGKHAGYFYKTILFHTTGNLFLYIIGDYLSYNTVLWVCLAIPTFHIVLFMMMPESPSYLVKRGKIEEAGRVLAWLRCRSEGDKLVQQEIDVIKKEQLNDEGSSHFVLKAILTDKIQFRAFRIAVVICLAREICGAIPVLNFAGDIFDTASQGSVLVLSPNQQAMVLGAVQVAGSLFASSVVEKAGRKPLLFVTSLISGLSMCVLASWFLSKSYGWMPPAWLPIVTLCLCIFCDASGLQPVSVVISSEIFSYKFRSTVMASIMAAASVVAFLQMLFFKMICNAIGIHVAFYSFGVVCIAAAVYVILVIPETKQRSLAEIHHDLMTKKEKESEVECTAKV